MTRELSAANGFAGLVGSAIAGNDDLALAFDGENLHLSCGGGSMEYTLRFSNPDVSLGLTSSQSLITLGADEAHTLRPSLVEWAERLDGRARDRRKTRTAPSTKR